MESGLKTKTKYFFATITIILFGITLWVYSSLSGYTGCGSCLTDQDFDFARALDAELQEVGDTIMVADIHSGNWEDVCAISGGFDLGLLGFADDKKNAVVINDAYPYITDLYGDSAIIFRYSDTDLEIYRMIPEHLTYSLDRRSIPKKATTSCISKKYAQFRLQTRNPGNTTILLMSKQEENE